MLDPQLDPKWLHVSVQFPAVNVFISQLAQNLGPSFGGFWVHIWVRVVRNLGPRLGGIWVHTCHSGPRGTEFGSKFGRNLGPPRGPEFGSKFERNLGPHSGPCGAELRSKFGRVQSGVNIWVQLWVAFLFQTEIQSTTASTTTTITTTNCPDNNDNNNDDYDH